MHLKLPFGVAQIGKSFRNEITPGNFIFRTREFEQMEIEYFVNPNDTIGGRPAADRVVGVDEVLDLHLLELAGPENEVAGGDLVPEALPDLGDSEGKLQVHRLQHVVEVDEDPLGRLRSPLG